jgi:hypothetical protein
MIKPSETATKTAELMIKLASKYWIPKHTHCIWRC